jgi:HPt (histidine-containing phosphotransfer) domain-containing protein
MPQKIKVHVDREIQDLVPTFLANRKRDLATLREALTTKNFEAMRIIGHNLKGVGGGYGFHEITAIGALMEKAGKDAQPETLAELIQRYGDYLEAVDVEYV